jgi:hypothetical protein
MKEKSRVSSSGSLFDKARSIRQKSGIRTLLASAWRYALSPVYTHDRFDLYTYEIKNDQNPDNLSSSSPIDRITHKVVTSFEDADKLEKEGFALLSDTTYWKRRRELYTRRINQGAIAWCSFVGPELAAIVWIIPSKKSQEDVKTSKVKVDYSKGEVLAAGAWAHPKYRKLAFFNYNYRSLQKFFSERGIKKVIIPVNQTFITTHKTSYSLMKIVGGRKYGKGDYYRIIRYRFWKESCNNKLR